MYSGNNNLNNAQGATTRLLNRRGHSSQEETVENEEDKKVNVPSHWKEDPDMYFSWALTCCTLAKGHLFVDLLPGSAQMYKLARPETEAIAKRFQIAAREFLDTNQVHLILCEKEMSPEFFYKYFAIMLQSAQPQNQQQQQQQQQQQTQGSGGPQQAVQAQPQQQQQQQKKEKKPRRGPETGAFASKNGRSKRHNNTIKARQHSIHHMTSPYVFILQDVDVLSHDSQMVLAEILSKRSLPISLVPNQFGQPGMEPAFLTNSHVDIKVPLVLIGVSNSLQVPTIDYKPVSASVSQTSCIAPQLLQCFFMRIPIKLPSRFGAFLPAYHHRDHHPSGEYGFEDDPSAGPSPLSPSTGGSPMDLPGSPSSASVHQKFLWAKDDDVQVGGYFVPKPGQSVSKPFRLMKVDLKPGFEIVHSIHISLDMETYLRNIITALRMHPYVLSGPSSACYSKLQEGVKVVAGFIRSSQFVRPADVTEIVVEILAHQVVLSLAAFPDMDQGLGKHRKSYPKDWHPLSAARYVVAQTVKVNVPTIK